MSTESEYNDQPQEFEGSTHAIKVPPNSIEAEQSVIGALLLDSNAWDTVADRVSEVDFYRLTRG